MSPRHEPRTTQGRLRAGRDVGSQGRRLLAERMEWADLSKGARVFHRPGPPLPDPDIEGRGRVRPLLHTAVHHAVRFRPACPCSGPDALQRCGMTSRSSRSARRRPGKRDSSRLFHHPRQVRLGHLDRTGPRSRLRGGPRRELDRGRDRPRRLALPRRTRARGSMHRGDGDHPGAPADQPRPIRRPARPDRRRPAGLLQPLADLVDAFARVRRVLDDLPLGIFALAGAVPSERVAALRTPFGKGFLSRFLGEAAAVAQTLCNLEGLGFDRVQPTEPAPGTLGS